MDPHLSQVFLQAAKELGVRLGDRQMHLFAQYLDILRFWNSKMNLVSARNDREILEKHFLDGLTPVPILPHRAIRIIDIGSGAGLPGIPLKIAVDAWHLYLVEASRKRSSFLKEVVRGLDLSHTFVIHDRVENLLGQASYRQTFDAVISRATLKLPQLIEIANDLLVSGGMLLAMKGVIPEQERVEANQISENTGLLYVEAHEVFLPATNTSRKIIIYKKH